MDLRQYDPAIGRWVVQDPVIHHDYSPYSAFDNNPVYWSDPSGANSVRYNWGSGDYDVLDGNGKWVGSFDPSQFGDYQSNPEEFLQSFFSLELSAGDSGNNGGGSDGNGNGNGESKNNKQPVYHYNGKKYNDGAELYFAILIDIAAEQFGITDIIALGTAIDGLGFVDKPFQMKGASKGTSLLSKGLSSQFPQKMPWRLPTISNNLTLKFTNVLGRFMGRTIPIIGWGVLTYDVGMTLYRTQVIYNNITN